MKVLVALAVAGAGFASQAMAAEVTGGSLDFQYSGFTEDSSVARFMAAGSMEIGFNRAFATQLDIAGYRFNSVGETGYTGTAHAVFHASESTSLGVFLGRDEISGSGLTFYGLEAGFEAGQFNGEAHYTKGDSNGSDSNIFGLSVGYAFANAFEAKAHLDRLDAGGGLDSTRFSVGLDYEIANGNTTLYGEIGSVDVSASNTSLGSNTFIGIGAKFDLGADRGTTFGRRGVLNFFPGL